MIYIFYWKIWRSGDLVRAIRWTVMNDDSLESPEPDDDVDKTACWPRPGGILNPDIEQNWCSIIYSLFKIRQKKLRIIIMIKKKINFRLTAFERNYENESSDEYW